MRSRWHHFPRVRHYRDGSAKVEWLEILVDVVVASCLVQVASLLPESMTSARVLSATICAASLWLVWSGATFFANRFELDDLPHRALVLVQVLGVGAMGVTAREALGGDWTLFAIAFAVSQAAVCVAYIRGLIQAPIARPFCMIWGSAFGMSAVVAAVCAVVPPLVGLVLWGLTVIGFFAVTMHPASRRVEADIPLHEEHLSRRFGLFVMVLIGASLVNVQADLSTDSADLQTLGRGAFHLLISLSMWWIYFDDVAGRRLRDAPGASLVWRLAHLPLSLCLTLVGLGVTLVATGDMDVPAAAAGRWLLGGSLAGVLVSVAVVDTFTERYEAALSDRTRIGIRVLTALFVLVLTQAASDLSTTVYLLGIVALCVGQVITDMLAVPLEAGVIEGARPTAEVDRERRKGTGSKQGNLGGVDNTLRIGVAARSGRDLYFFLMEGSWTRVLIAFGVAYVVINALFAGLYQVESGSISGTVGQTYADAFFFSVQTLTSLGYGVYAPATPWAHSLVTVESAVGILYGALATGMMFAKASRPRASILWSEKIVVNARHGQPTLMLRVANSRGNDVVGASLTISVLLDEVTPEGDHMRRLFDLELVRDVTPLFRLTWSVMHVIDEDSPLYEDDIWEHVFGFIVTLTGYDGTYSQTIYARHVYGPEDVYQNHRFVDVLSQTDEGRIVLDLDKFHLIKPMDD